MADSSVISDIKDRLDIVEVLSGYIKLNKAGRNFKALCPFHNEKTPSFMVNPERQVWHCFGCGEGGDVFSFVMKMDGLEFPEALKMLAEKAGVELRRDEFRSSGQKNRILACLENAAVFYESVLEDSPEGHEAKEYLLSRGIKEESIKKWRLGFAPDDWRATLKYLTGQGFTGAEVLSSGLAIEKTNAPRNSSADARFHDRFRGRVMFPIADVSGKVVGFGGRIFSAERKEQATERKDAAKYINTPQTLVYNKSRILYGLDKAKTTVTHSDFCILVEGYTDVIASYQTGVKNVVSSSGTSLTVEQLRLIKRYTENIVISYDMDLAGEGATRRGIELAFEEGFNIKVTTLPDDQDPADAIEIDPNIWKKAIRDKKPILDHYFNETFKRFDPANVAGKKSIVNFLLPLLGKVSSFVEQAEYVRRLSERLGVDEKVLLEEVKKYRPEKTERFSPRPPREKADNKMFSGGLEYLEEMLLGVALAFVNDIKNVFPSVDTAVFGKADLKDMAERFKVFLESKKEIMKDQEQESVYWQKEFGKTLTDEERQKTDMLAFKAEELYGTEETDFEKEFMNMYRRLLKQKKQADLKNLDTDIKKALAEKDREAYLILQKEKNKIFEELTKFE